MQSDLMQEQYVNSTKVFHSSFNNHVHGFFISKFAVTGTDQK